MNIIKLDAVIKEVNYGTSISNGNRIVKPVTIKLYLPIAKSYITYTGYVDEKGNHKKYRVYRRVFKKWV